MIEAVQIVRAPLDQAAALPGSILLPRSCGVQILIEARLISWSEAFL